MARGQSYSDCPSQENQENHWYSLRYYSRSESVEHCI
nr:MAG TPA: hypothetical protein [Caudoviricetes sp.]